MSRDGGREPATHDEGWPRRRPLRPRSDGWRYRRAGPPARHETTDGTLLIVMDSALQAAWDHSHTDLRREVGGLLVGGYYVDDTPRPGFDAGLDGPDDRDRHGRRDDGRGLEYVEIEGFVPALEGQSGSAQFRFTPESWTAMRLRKEPVYGDERHTLNVGWHHTHPGIGLFLSGLDQWQHGHYFPEPWMPALVIDPRSGELEFFRMIDGRVETWPFILMVRS